MGRQGKVFISLSNIFVVACLTHYSSQFLTQHHTSYIRRHVNLTTLTIMLVKRNEEKRGLLDPENQEEDSDSSMAKVKIIENH